MSSRFHKLLQHPHTEKALLLLLLTICGLAFGLNMFNFPYYENDEGVYMSQAWSLFETGRLAPYTYWYDHAPFGWIQIGLWAILTGGYFTFGFAINSGRVFMLVIHLINCLILYLIARKLTASRIWATLTVLLFGLSPLGILLQRRVLLDNLALFWSLISIYFAVYYEKRFYYLILSGFTLGLAILSKESVIFFAPVIAFYILVIAHKQHRLHGIVLWSVTLATLLGLYITYAFMKNELFPSGSILGGQGDHVSLIETLSFQAQREGGGNILNPSQSQFWQRFLEVWSKNDRLLIYGGLFATLANLLLGFRNLHAGFLALLSLSFILFLGRGGLVLDFYIIPLLPMLALNLTYLLHTLIYPLLLFTRNLPIRTLSYALTLLLLILPTLHFLYQKDRIGIENFSLYTSNQTKPQIEAVNWIKTKLAPDDYLAFDNYAYLDLKVRDRSHTFPNADWYIKIDTDKEIREKFNNDSKSIEYLALTPQIEQDIATFSQGLPLVEQAFKESREITTFYNDRWRVKIMGQLTPTRITESAYRSIKTKFTNNQEITWYNTKYIDYKLFLHLAILQNDLPFFQPIFDIFKAKYSNNEQYKNDAIKSIGDQPSGLIMIHRKWDNASGKNVFLPLGLNASGRLNLQFNPCYSGESVWWEPYNDSASYLLVDESVLGSDFNLTLYTDDDASGGAGAKLVLSAADFAQAPAIDMIALAAPAESFGKVSGLTSSLPDQYNILAEDLGGLWLGNNGLPIRGVGLNQGEDRFTSTQVPPCKPAGPEFSNDLGEAVVLLPRETACADGQVTLWENDLDGQPSGTSWPIALGPQHCTQEEVTYNVSADITLTPEFCGETKELTGRIAVQADSEPPAGSYNFTLADTTYPLEFSEEFAAGSAITVTVTTGANLIPWSLHRDQTTITTGTLTIVGESTGPCRPRDDDPDAGVMKPRSWLPLMSAGQPDRAGDDDPCDAASVIMTVNDRTVRTWPITSDTVLAAPRMPLNTNVVFSVQGIPGQLIMDQPYHAVGNNTLTTNFTPSTAGSPFVLHWTSECGDGQASGTIDP